MFFKILVLLFFCASVSASLIDDLETASYWDCKRKERLPSTYSHLLSTGYFVTPSARMTANGLFGVGAMHTFPNDIVSLRLQLYRFFEISAHSRIHINFKEKHHSTKNGASAKLAIFTPEDSCNVYPGLAIGINDFTASEKFLTPYIVGTQVFINQGLEFSLGWGAGRFYKGPSYGLFGAVSWFPLLHSKYKWAKGLGLAVEYDPQDCHKAKSQINCGIHYTFSDLIDLSASYLHFKDFAVGGSVHFNIGKCNGFFPKMKDPPPFRGCPKTDNFIKELGEAFCEQGFCLMRASLYGCNLWLSVENVRYRFEPTVRCRIEHILAALLPGNIEKVTVVLESYGLPCQQYVYHQDILRRFATKTICPYEFQLLTPRQNAMRPLPGPYIFRHRREFSWPKLSPRFESFIGNGKEKFKYDLGLKADFDGFLPFDTFYDLQFSYNILPARHVGVDTDMLTQLPIVLTDYVNYRRVRNIALDRLYLQKNWNMGGGWFGRVVGGYFQINYAGVGGEILFYPAQSYFGMGLEGTLLRKRTFTGLGFQNTLRKFKDGRFIFVPYSTLHQYFLSFYADIPEWRSAAKASVGGFLASDKGLRLEFTRYFESGLRLTGWWTVTNAYANMRSNNFYNHGIAIELPLDFFFRCSSRRVWNYGTAAWFRDAGAFIPVGKSLFDIVNRERRR